MSITITEALAEIKTIGKRLEKKQAALLIYVGRQEGVKDPLEKSGGSATHIEQERQSIGDLNSRVIALRRGIQTANRENEITVNGTTRTIADWLTWRREVAPREQQLLGQIRNHINSVRQNAQRTQTQVRSTPEAEGAQPQDWVINIDEKLLNSQIEGLEETLGALDGQLSLKNATVLII